MEVTFVGEEGLFEDMRQAVVWYLLYVNDTMN